MEVEYDDEKEVKIIKGFIPNKMSITGTTGEHPIINIEGTAASELESFIFANGSKITSTTTSSTTGWDEI